MNISAYTRFTHGKQLVNNQVFCIQRPSDSLFPLLNWQSTQAVVQIPNFVPFIKTQVEQCITRCRVIYHDGGALLVSTVNSSLEGLQVQRKEQNEVFVWKREQRRISNG